MKIVPVLPHSRETVLKNQEVIKLQQELFEVQTEIKEKGLLDVPVSQLPSNIQQELLSILQASNEVERRVSARMAYAGVASKRREHRVVEKLENGGYFE